jgi:hypothetical protein
MKYYRNTVQKYYAAGARNASTCTKKIVHMNPLHSQKDRPIYILIEMQY